MNPITEGPVRNPISPPVVTIANPSTALTPGMLADALNNTGTIQEHPSPTKIYPKMAVMTSGAVTTSTNPAAASKLPNTTTFLLPSVEINISPFNLPTVIATEKAAYPRLI